MNGDYRFVRHREVQRFLDKGWHIVSFLKETHHGFWSVIMKAP